MKTKILYFSMGFITCFVGLFLIAGILGYKDPYTRLRKFPKKFGDIKIAALKPADLRENEDIDEILMMTKNDIPFFYASANKSGKVTEIAILGAEKQIRFALFASEHPGGWERAMYSHDRDNYTIGDEYIDIDFDGQFDVKHSFNDQGERVAKYIYVDNDWKLVDPIKGKVVRVGGAKYVFDPNTGWQQNNVHSLE